jgi:hypothetical protein
MRKRRNFTHPQNEDEDSKALFILDNLSAGRTPEELIAQNSGLSLDVIEATKKRVLEWANYDEDRSFFRSNLRIRHLIVALQPHPIVNIICDAFEGVRLGKGPSLRQTYIMDNYGEDDSGKRLSHQQFERLKNEDEINQWKAVKIVDFDVYRYFSYCDAESFRFYIPARMIYGLAATWWELMWDLNPIERFQGAREYLLNKYSLLNDEQRHAVASFLLHISKDIEYAGASSEIASAFQNFWMQYL